MKKLALVALIITVLLVTQLAAAHHDQICEGVFYERNFDVIVQYATIGQDAVNNNNLEAALSAIQNLQRITASVQALCMDLAFNNDSDGMVGSIGPVTIPTGLYQAHVITNGPLTLNITPVSGTCPTETVLDVFPGQATAPNGVYASLESTDCVGLIEISNASQPWSLQFQPVDVDGNLITEASN